MGQKKYFMKKLINHSLLFFVGILFISCSKDSSSPSLEGKWHFSASGAKGSGSTIIWTPNQEDSCESLTYTEFVSNGSIFYQEYYTNLSTGACVLYVDPNPTSHSETWVRTGDDVTITNNYFTVPTTVYTFKAHIVSLTDSELIVQEYDQTNVNLIDSYSKFSRR